MQEPRGGPEPRAANHAPEAAGSEGENEEEEEGRAARGAALSKKAPSRARAAQ